MRAKDGSSSSAVCVAPRIVRCAWLDESSASLSCDANQPACCPTAAVRTTKGLEPSVVRACACLNAVGSSMNSLRAASPLAECQDRRSARVRHAQMSGRVPRHDSTSSRSSDSPAARTDTASRSRRAPRRRPGSGTRARRRARRCLRRNAPQGHRGRERARQRGAHADRRQARGRLAGRGRCRSSLRRPGRRCRRVSCLRRLAEPATSSRHPRRGRCNRTTRRRSPPGAAHVERVAVHSIGVSGLRHRL